jgi:hypothetical protein
VWQTSIETDEIRKFISHICHELCVRKMAFSWSVTMLDPKKSPFKLQIRRLSNTGCPLNATRDLGSHFSRLHLHYFKLPRSPSIRRRKFYGITHLQRRGKVDSPVSKYLRSQKRLNPHTLFLWFWSSKNICSSSPNASKAAKISQFSKGMGKIWGVWCKEVQCSMMGELK